MSDSPSYSPAKPTPSGGSAFKSKIAAFESGAAANASKRDQAKHIPHADLSNLRSRFDREGEKPLEVKGSFGLGAAPPAARTGGLTASRDGHRAVSLGSGRAVSPMHSPSVVAPGNGPSQAGPAKSASSNTLSSVGSSGGNNEGRIPTSSARPLIPRSDSMGSNSTSATSTSISGATATSTASSLLPGPLAALRASGNAAPSNSPYGGGDDSLSAGLRTPMSSISLSSLHVEAGSVIGDFASSAGDTTANEDQESNILDREDLVTTPHKERSFGDIPVLKTGDTGQAMPDESIELSAAALEKRKDLQAVETDNAANAKKASSVLSEDSSDIQQPPQEAVERAAEELDKYTLEKSSTTALFSPTPEESDTLPKSLSSSSLAVPDVDENGSTPLASERLPTPPPSSARKSPVRATSSSFSPTDRLKRSSTANSIASHPESDLADANLETFDEVNDAGKAKMVGDSMVPPPAHGQYSDVPIDTSGPEPEVGLSSPGGPSSPLDKLLQEEQDFAPVDADDSTNETDEDGMPLVKCSDCGDKVSLVKLAEHVCDTASTPAAGNFAFPTSGRNSDESLKPSLRDRRETGPEDVPKGALSPEPMPSPQMSHRSMTSSRPDVPDDESVSTASLSRDLEDTHINEDNNFAARHENIPSVPLDSEEVEEDYMTALTSHRDSIDTSNTPRPDFISNLPESISDPRLFHPSNNVDYYEDDETEELALGMADAPLGTPRTGSFPNGSGQARQMHPDSPTPEQRQILSPTNTTNGSLDQMTPQLNRTSNQLATPSHDFSGATGVRRRSSAGQRNKNLGDTDSEGETEPGRVTIIR